MVFTNLSAINQQKFCLELKWREAEADAEEDTELPELLLLEGVDDFEIPGTQAQQLRDFKEEDAPLRTAIYVHPAFQLNFLMLS